MSIIDEIINSSSLKPPLGTGSSIQAANAGVHPRTPFGPLEYVIYLAIYII